MISALSSALFWPASLRLRVGHHSPSILTHLPARSVVALPKIAVRKPKHGRSYDDKKAIIHVVNTQIVKLAIISLAVIFTIYVYNISGLFALSLIPSALLFGFILDFLRWNSDYEQCLIKELNERKKELGIANIPVPDNLGELAVRDEMLNVSAFRDRTESYMGEKERIRAKLKFDGARGREHYTRILSEEPDFETIHHGEWINININTGEYLLGESKKDVSQKFDSAFKKNLPCWQKHIGHLRRVPNFNRTIQPIR